MKIVLWGYGKVGRKTLQLLCDTVVAIIDNDISKQGIYVSGIPIISFDQYLNKLSDVLILISIKDMTIVSDIIAQLKKVNITHYVLYNDCFPKEMIGHNAVYNREKYLEKYSNILVENEYIIYGINYYSLFLANYFIKERNFKVKFISLDDYRYEKCSKDSLELINRNSILDNYTILLCEENYSNVFNEFLNHRIINLYHLSNKFSFYSNELKKFKQIYQDKRCFIVATGPSLAIKDLEKLQNKNEYTFAVNTSYKIFDKIEWRPSFYVVTDKSCLEIYGKEILDQKLKEYFFTDSNLDFMNKNNMNNNLHYIHAVYDKSDGLIRFSEDISKQVYNNAEGGTVIYSCLQIAVYMGFSEIYILGADCDYSTSKKHFIENYYHENDDGDKRKFNYEGVFKEYQSAKWYADCHDVKIYNATRGGKLEIFDRVDFDSLFE